MAEIFATCKPLRRQDTPDIPQSLTARMAADELEAAETELAVQLTKHEDALQDVRHALHLDQGNAELIEVTAPCRMLFQPADLLSWTPV